MPTRSNWLQLIVWSAVLSLFACGHVLAEESGPMKLARQSAEAMRTGDVELMARLVHPAELKLFRAFALEAFERDPKEQGIVELRAAFAPFESADDIRLAKDEAILAAFLKQVLAQVPNYKELFANAKPEYLGEIAEGPDRVYVIVRTLSPRPQAVGCIRDEGQWHLLLNDQTQRAIEGLKIGEKLRRRFPGNLDVVRNTRITKVEVLGHVMDGDDCAQVLCRNQAQIGDITTEIMGLYPVRDGDEAWEKLNAGKESLAKALLTKWEANEQQKALKSLK